MSGPPDVAMTIEERLRRMVEHPKRRNRGQVPMELVHRALAYQREHVPTFADLHADSVQDCTESLERMRTDKREARERRAMTWEDHLATTVRDEHTRRIATQAKKLAQETAMLGQLRTERDKWNMAVDLRLCEYLGATLAVAALGTRVEYLGSRNGSGHAPLHRAAKTKDPRVVQLLLDCGADVAATVDSSGKTALHWAAENGAVDVFRVLLQGITPSETRVDALVRADNGGSTALHLAAAHGHESIAAMILEELTTVAPTNSSLTLSGLVNHPTKKDNVTAVHLAAQQGHAGCLALLLGTGVADTNARTARGSNALHLALQQTFHIDRLVQLFLDHVVAGGDQDGTFQTFDDATGLNCLHTAIAKHFRSVSLALIQSHRLSLNLTTRDGGWTPLHLAVVTEAIDVLRALLEAGAMVDLVDNDGQTPLCQACLGGQLEIVRLLLGFGANPAHQNKQAHSPLHYLSAFCRDRELLEEVIRRGADVNAKSLKLNTPLHFAAMAGNEVAAEVLLAHGANASAINEDRRSAVYLAKKWRHRAVEDLVKPPEERERDESTTAGSSGSPRPRSGDGIHAAATRNNHPHSLSPGHRRPVAFMGHASGPSRGITSATSRGRSGAAKTARSDDSDDDSLYSFYDEENDDDEAIAGPSTPWPIADGPAAGGEGPRGPVRSFGELRDRFMCAQPQSRDEDVDRTRRRRRRGGQKGLKPVVPGNRRTPPARELAAAREIVDGAPPSALRLTRFTRHLLTEPVEFPWELTVPTTGAAASGGHGDSELQRRLKPSVRADIGRLRDHLTHAQKLNWPRYAHQRVFRKDPTLP